MILDLNIKIKNLKGRVMRMSFPTPEEQKAADNKPENLPDETVENVILNSLAGYAVKTTKEVFVSTNIAARIMEAEDGKIELSEKEVAFLTRVLSNSVYQEDARGNKSGVYMSYVIAQVLHALGVDELEGN